MKKILILALPLLLTVLSARADVIWQEKFLYTNGPVIVTSTNTVAGSLVTNWIRFSGTATPSDLLVNNNRLEISSTGSGLPTPTRQDDCGRPFSNTNSSIYTNSQQVVYTSFIINFTNIANMPTTAASAQYFGMFKFGALTGTSYEGRVFALAGSLTNTFRLGVAVGSALSRTLAVDLTTNTDYQVILKWDPVNDLGISVWVNPISSDDPKATSSDAFTPSSSNIADMWAFRQATGFGGFLTVSNVVVATSFDEAATNVWATNAVAPKVVYQPPAATTNFQNDVASLTAVATGQGLGSLIYQWQVSASPANTSLANVSNPNGNSSVLSLDTSTIGSQYYTLIVTTPYGLSTTSSVAKVVIRTPQAPPVFVSQPASTTNYNGQTVTLTTTVQSPGNITYTWYSNNVVVTAGQADSGQSSSYTIANLTTNDSATYKVAVTNDTVTTGIVSTNAVLTVLPTPAVSIAYLHSLINPGTFLPPTPASIPYQVTGIVTTLTNITTGNTASYYLQDATAGINIFVTGGSTFRPVLGDEITFTGVLSYYTSGLELYADTTGGAFTYTSFTVLSNNIAGLPAPLNIPYNILADPSNANYNLGGRYCQISDVHFGASGGTTVSNATVIVTNSLGQSFNLLFPGMDLDVSPITLPNYAYTVSGIVYSANNIVTNTLLVTRTVDINTTAPLPIPLTATYAGGNLTLNWADSSFSLQSSTNVSGPYTTIGGATSGFTTNTTATPMLFFRLIHP